jgi:hypothetical protein
MATRLEAGEWRPAGATSFYLGFAGRLGFALRWSVRLMVLGVLIILLGLVPPLATGLSVGSAEAAASFFAIGILVLLFGLLLRRLQKAFS